MKPAFPFFSAFCAEISLLVGSLMILGSRQPMPRTAISSGRRALGRLRDDEGYDIFVDAAGNVYTTGYFQGTVDFDPGPGTLQPDQCSE